MVWKSPAFREKIEKFKWKLLSFGENFVEKAIRNLLRKHGYCVARHPYVFLTVPILIVSVLTVGVSFMTSGEDVSVMYTPSNARAHVERKIGEQYFNDEGGVYGMKMIITAKDGGSLLRQKYIKDVLDLIDFMENKYKAKYNDMIYSFSDIRISHTNENDVLKTFLKIYNTTNNSTKNEKSLYHFGYPVFSMNTVKLSLAPCIGGVTLNPNDNQIESAKLVFIRIRSAKGNQSHAKLIHNWELKFLKPDTILVHPTLNFIAGSDRLASVEIQRNGNTIRNFTPISFLCLIIFAVITSSNCNCLTSKPWEAFCGVFTTVLSVGGSYGIMCFAGYPFIGLMLVMPVLVLALGLDVTFIVLRSWKTTNPELSVENRLAETLAESGPSIVITSLTNIISAGIGAITYTPAVHMFCLCTAIAVTLLFFLQITFFAATIALGARRENAQKHALLLCVKVTKEPDVNTEVVGHTKNGSNIPIHLDIDDFWCKIAAKLAAFECTYVCRILVTIMLLVYWSTAIWGCTKLTLGITPEKFFLPDSILTTFFALDNAGLHEALTLYVFVSNAPNFSIPQQANKFDNLINDLEHLPTSFGPDTTMLWRRAYNDFEDPSFWNQNSAESDHSNLTNYYKSLPQFLDLDSKWSKFLTTTILDDNTTYVPKFFFSTTFKPAKSWSQRTEFTLEWRQIVDSYSEFNVSIWDDENENYLADQLLSIPQNTIQDVVVTGVCMVIICILFIPNIFNTLCAMLTIFSINVGVFGFLVHWGVSLDPIAMATILMAIGFSVDFTSHISFHYYTSEGVTQKEKLTSAIASIGYPMLQSGTSTVLSIACVCFIPSYMVWIFFKTVFLVVVFGLLHGLLFLPTYLAWLPLNFWDFLYTKNQAPSINYTGSVKSTLRENKPDIVCDVHDAHLQSAGVHDVDDASLKSTGM